MAASDLGERIKRARERQGWTQEKLARELTLMRPERKRPVGVRSVGRWERGQAVPRDAIGALEALFKTKLTGPEPDPQEEAIRDLGKDRGGFLPPGEVDLILRAYWRDRHPRAG